MQLKFNYMQQSTSTIKYNTRVAYNNTRFNFSTYFGSSANCLQVGKKTVNCWYLHQYTE